MELKLFRHLWGIDEEPATVFPRIQSSGYHGIESPLPEPAERDQFDALLTTYGFSYIAQIFTSGTSIAEHLTTFRDAIAQAATLRPVLINSHSGRDNWNRSEREQFFRDALLIEADMGIPVAHETHRGRVLYNPWVTSEVLETFAIRLCCDYSHWVCVAERLLDDEKEILDLCADHALHVHTRVGYEEGPQVPDPRAPEYQRHVEAHERWWDMIWDSQIRRGMVASTLTPEYGPPPYLHTLPYSNTPVADGWAIADWQAHRQQERFRNVVVSGREAARSEEI